MTLSGRWFLEYLISCSRGCLHRHMNARAFIRKMGARTRGRSGPYSRERKKVLNSLPVLYLLQLQGIILRLELQEALAFVEQECVGIAQRLLKLVNLLSAFLGFPFKPMELVVCHGYLLEPREEVISFLLEQGHARAIMREQIGVGEDRVQLSLMIGRRHVRVCARGR